MEMEINRMVYWQIVIRITFHNTIYWTKTLNIIGLGCKGKIEQFSWEQKKQKRFVNGPTKDRLKDN